MNIDNPKLTAFALDELGEPERSTIAREIAESPEAQRTVDETREMARLLKSEFLSELNEPTKPSRSLSDIRDDPVFWARARPLALAAAIAIFAILGAVVITTYTRRVSSGSNLVDYSIQGEETPNAQSLPAVSEPTAVPNPFRDEAINRIERVVIGEIGPDFENRELHMIEMINDAYRIQRLKDRLRIPIVSKKSYNGITRRGYGLLFLDRNGRIVAAAAFYSVPQQGFVLQPLRNAYESEGHYFLGGNTTLPGDWKNNLDYRNYAIPFADWKDCVGYAPGA
jgi:hypothetical protein